MKRLAVLFASLFAYILSLYFSLALAAPTAQAGNVTVGVNVVGIENMNEQQQDALIAQLQKDRVKVVRTGSATASIGSLPKPMPVVSVCGRDHLSHRRRKWSRYKTGRSGGGPAMGRAGLD
jgi:hypothetical protein